MSSERDEQQHNGTEWTKEPAGSDRRFDFDAFLGEASLEDQVTDALDGKDLLDEEAYGKFGPGYIPRRAAPGDRGRHEAPSQEEEPEEEEPEEEEQFGDGLPTQRFTTEPPTQRFNEAGEIRSSARQQPFREQRPQPSPVRDEPPPRPKVVVASPARTVVVTPQTEYGGDDGGRSSGGGSGKGAKVLLALLITLLVIVAAGALIVILFPGNGQSGEPAATPTPTPTMYLFGGLPTVPPAAPATAEPTQAPTPPPITTYTVTVTAGSGGSVSPNGSVSVQEGSSVTFTITPYDGYVLGQLLVDGSNVSVQSSYTFTDVRQNHTIYAVFQPAETAPPPQTAEPTPEVTPEPTEEPIEPPPLAGEWGDLGHG